MGGKPCIQYDPEEFRRLWMADATCQEIADRFGAKRAWPSLTAKRMGLPSRQTKHGTLPVAAIVAAYVAGQSLDDIRLALRPKFPKVSNHMLATYIRSRGVELRPNGRVRKLPIAEVVRMSRAGVVDRIIGQRFGCSPSGVAKIVRAVLGPRPHGGHRHSKFDHAEMWRMLRAGETVRDIAAKFNVTKQAIRWHMRKRKQKKVSA